ncbi:MAG: helix-turn-helix domain-containing protein [Bacteroidales bacterium]|jgi:transcriptional regulator GlxA family with amidase domain|nr:helix-turn-helix domain-containing protein [Bacteroidales bacterium]
MNIAILDFDKAVKSSVIGPYDMLSQINDLTATFRPDLKIKQVDVSIVNIDNINRDITYDLIIIPAMHFIYIKEVLEQFSDYNDWFTDQYNRGAEIASMCLGAFILASTGLLNGKPATTHWMGADNFRQMFPDVNLVDERIITDYQRIYTSGGAYSFTSMIVYLVDKIFGHDVAVLISKVFLVNINDISQTSFNILSLQKNHGNDDIERVQAYIEQNFTEELPVADLASLANMTLRTFERNFKKYTGDTPSVYIRKVKIEKAKRLLETETIGVEQVCYEVGYSDFASFRKVFKKIVGIIPSEYKKIYGNIYTTGALA